MEVTESTTRKISITSIVGLDPVTVFLEQYGPQQGRITIVCFGQAWSAFWGAMGSSLVDFFLSCDVHYIAKKMSSIQKTIFDEDALRKMAIDHGIPEFDLHDDISRDHHLLAELFGPDPIDWHDKIPKTENPDYAYLCHIIKATQDGIRLLAGSVEEAKAS